MLENEEVCAKLRNAIKQGNMARIEEALDSEGVNPNSRWSRDITSHTPLTQAVEMDRADIVTLLLSHPLTDPNLNGIDGFTPLTFAVSKGSKDIVKILLSAPAIDLNLREGGGMTALHLGCLYNNTDIVRILLSDKRVDSNLKFSGQTALDLANSLETPNKEVIDAFNSS